MEYSGRDNLEVMKYATNYNDAIFNWISSAGTCNKMLDFGAGVGEFCNRFRKDQIEAVEIDVTLHNSINCKVYKALSDISTLFCLIYSLNVLEHIEDDQSYVTQLSFYLESDGLVKILVPARGELYSAMDEKVGHYRRYSKGQLVMLFENSGYDVLECRYFDFIGYFASLVYKVVGNKNGDISIGPIKFYDKYIFPISLLIDKITMGMIIGKNLKLVAVKKK